MSIATIEKGDIVETPRGLATVIDDKDYDFLAALRCRVKLNEYDKETVFSYNLIKLVEKMPSQIEATEAADKIGTLLDNSPLSNIHKEELATHLGYYKNDIQNEKYQVDKNLMLANLRYIDDVLKAYKEVNSTASCWELIEPKMKKMRWRAEYT